MGKSHKQFIFIFVVFFFNLLILQAICFGAMPMKRPLPDGSLHQRYLYGEKFSATSTTVHTGVDFPGDPGRPVYSAVTGKVDFTESGFIYLTIDGGTDLSQISKDDTITTDSGSTTATVKLIVTISGSNPTQTAKLIAVDSTGSWDNDDAILITGKATISGKLSANGNVNTYQGRNDVPINDRPKLIQYGNYVRIESSWNDQWKDHTLYTYYGHLSSVDVIQNQEVIAGVTIIGYTGNSGYSSGPHLHFEIREDSISSANSRNPEVFMEPRDSNSGAILGKVPGAADNTPVYINPNRKAPLFGHATIYNKPANPHDIYHENYAIGDLPAGTYTITCGDDYTRVVTVKPREVVYADPIGKALMWLYGLQTKTNDETSGSWFDHVGLTAMATLAFQNADYTENKDEVVKQGIQYLISKYNVNGDYGIYGNPGYANYETSLSILALKAAPEPNYNDEIANAANYIKSIQSDDSDDPATSWFGGWGYREAHQNVWSDLSNSQFSAMALDAAGIPKTDDVWKRFLQFLSRVQNDEYNDMPWATGRNDGGFTYSPHYEIWGDDFISYGSMTAAGIWGLRLSGVGEKEEKVEAALGWLEDKEDLNFNTNPMVGNNTRYYYYMAFAKAMAMCFLDQDHTETWYEGWYDSLTEKIASEQDDDGSWHQSQSRMVDTLWALLALQTVQPLPDNLWMSVILDSPANLLVYDSEDRVCGNDECNIPGASFEIDNDGRQIVTLPQLEPGHYLIVLIGTGNGTCHLTVNGHRGDEIISTEYEEVEILNGEQLESDVLVSSLVGALTITVEDPEPSPFIPVGIDICPEDCPDFLDVTSKGQLPLAILGTESFDVTKIDPDSLHLGGVYRKRWNLEDVTGPQDCTDEYGEYPDGNLDLTAKFSRPAIVDALGDVEDGEELILTLTGNLKEEFGGTPIRGEGIVIIVKD